MKKTENDDRVFYQGAGVVLGWLARDRYDFELKSCMDNNGISVDDLRKAKVDGFDLRPIVASYKRASK